MKKDTSVNVRLTTELRAKLQRLADSDARTLSAYIFRILQLHADAPEQSEKATETPRRGKTK